MDKELVLDQAVKVFTDINDRIDSLIECSANDFDILNQAFIEYHSKIEELTRNTNAVFEEFLAIPEDELPNHLNELDRLNSELEDVYENVQKAVSHIHKLNQDVDYALLFANNQKQNISTLRLLVTNIQLEPFSRSRYQELIEKINQLQTDNIKLVDEFSKADKHLQSCAETLEKVYSEVLPVVLQTAEHYKNGIFDLVMTKKDFLTSYDKLTDLKSRKKDSSSEIITNLQFQDIVRQKIEHVQKAQAKLLEQLQNYQPVKPADEKDSPDDLLRIIYQIRNIGTLQAAQMVHANNEYQKAIETITDKFEELDYILDETTDLLIGSKPPAEKNKEYFPQSLETAKKQFELNFSSFSDAVSLFAEQCADIRSRNEVMTEINQNIAECIKECEQVLSDLSGPDSVKGDQTDYTNLIQQVKNNFDSFLINTRELNKHLEKNRTKTEKQVIPVFTELRSKFGNLDKLMRNLMEKAETLLPDKKVRALKIHKEEISARKFDAHGIQYYSVFDKEIEEIITNLNQLIGKIDFREIEKHFDQKDLSDIKELYTMDSEREIHSIVTGERKKKNKDKNDLELF